MAAHWLGEQTISHADVGHHWLLLQVLGPAVRLAAHPHHPTQPIGMSVASKDCSREATVMGVPAFHGWFGWLRGMERLCTSSIQRQQRGGWRSNHPGVPRTGTLLAARLGFPIGYPSFPQLPLGPCGLRAAGCGGTTRSLPRTSLPLPCVQGAFRFCFFAGLSTGLAVRWRIPPSRIHEV
jgi:hypothetical protein